QSRKPIVENFYDLLPGCDAAKHGFPQRLFLYLGNEFLCDLKIDIRFQQREAHLTQRGVDIRFANRAVAAQLFENLLQLVAELWKHRIRRVASKNGRFPKLPTAVKETAAPLRYRFISSVLAPLAFPPLPRPLRFRKSSAPRLFCLPISR